MRLLKTDDSVKNIPELTKSRSRCRRNLHLLRDLLFVNQRYFKECYILMKFLWHNTEKIGRRVNMYKIRYAHANDARVLGEIHSSSWKIAYRGIVPDSILDHISADKKREVL